jgi:translation initiation factor IF-2
VRRRPSTRPTRRPLPLIRARPRGPMRGACRVSVTSSGRLWGTHLDTRTVRQRGAAGKRGRLAPHCSAKRRGGGAQKPPGRPAAGPGPGPPTREAANQKGARGGGGDKIARGAGGRGAPLRWRRSSCSAPPARPPRWQSKGSSCCPWPGGAGGRGGRGGRGAGAGGYGGVRAGTRGGHESHRCAALRAPALRGPARRGARGREHT